MYINKHQLQRGISLVEVFVALLVLSVGMIALAKLQVDLVRGGSDARARTIALNLAEEKIEDLRAFATVDDPGAVSWSTSASPMDWTYIDDNTGGRLPPQTAFSSVLEVAGVRFLRTWDVTDRDFTNVVSGITTRTKDVTVTVSWQSETGASQSGCPVANTRCVQTVANVVEIPPGNVALASEPVADRPDGPKVLYSPGEAPEIISVPIDTGSGRRETTKPLPDVQAQGDYAHEVRFDVVNYHLDGTDNIVDRREEFVSVNCRCALAGPGRGRTPARVSFVGNVLRDLPGEVIPNKSQTGVVKTSGTNGISQQPELCSICCRDHHDGPAVTVGSDTEHNRYNPTDTSDHQHYLYDPDADAFDLASSAGDAYDEACRLKRVNGIFNVYQDWNLKDILPMPENDLTDASIQTAYTTYVQDFVKNQANASLPSGTVPTFNSTTLVPGAAAQLSGRAIYIDHMPQNLIDFLNQTPLPASVADNFLSFVPFVEINLTKLANWKLQTISLDADYPTISGQDCSASTSQATLSTPPPGFIACIANQAIVDETVINVGEFQNYFRGLIKAGPVPGQLDAQVFAQNGNTGVTGTFPLTAAQASTTPVSAEYRFTVDSGQAISGQITKGENAPNGNFWSNITVTAASDCTLTGTGNSSRAFNCTVPSGWTGTVTATWAGHTFSSANNVFGPGENTLPASNVSFVVDP